MQGLTKYFRAFVACAIVCIILFYACVLALWYLPVIHWQASSLLIQKGSSLSQITTDIADSTQTAPSWVIRTTMDLMARDRVLHFGEYRLSSGLSLSGLMDHIEKKRGLVMHRITFIEGQTFAQMKHRLQANRFLSEKDQLLSNSQIMTQLGVKHQSLEGLFFPDTYQFAWDTDAMVILKQSHDKLRQVLQQAWQQRAPDLPYKTPYEALIVASLIEMETPTLSERPLIAGVILQRLKQGMRLQIDPTVSYGLHQPLRQPLTRSDLASITPYNTYKIHGLPPTPIALPSASSIQAAMHPVFKGYLFYVSTGHGEHRFSATYDEHLEAVSKYREHERQQKQKQSHLEQQQQWVDQWTLAAIEYMFRPLQVIIAIEQVSHV